MADTEPPAINLENSRRKELTNLFTNFIESGQVVGRGTQADRLRVEKVNEQLGNQILAINPTRDEVLDVIENNLPAVNYMGNKLVNKRETPTRPTREEMELAHKEIPPQNLFPESGYSEHIKIAVGGLQRFLATPRVRDSFTNHDF